MVRAYAAPAYAPFDPRFCPRVGLGDFWSDLEKAVNIGTSIYNTIAGGTSQQAKLDQAVVSLVDLAFQLAIAGEMAPRPEFGGRTPLDYLTAVAGTNQSANVRAYATAKLNEYYLRTQRGPLQGGLGGGVGLLLLGLAVGGVAAAVFTRPARQ